jgi:phosphatidylserine/phosphatidylglycerophosphate/cardiolipin synthase-like enzyme
MVGDGGRSYVGSANLTTASLDANREVGLQIDDAATARLLGDTIATDVARAATGPP